MDKLYLLTKAETVVSVGVNVGGSDTLGTVDEEGLKPGDADTGIMAAGTDWELSSAWHLSTDSTSFSGVRAMKPLQNNFFPK